MKKTFLPILLTALLLLTACSGQGEAPEDYIGIEAAKQAALTDAGLPAGAAADFSTAGLDRSEGEDFYALEFTAGGASYRYRIHPVTGEVLRASSQAPRLIGAEAAEEIALQHAGLAADQVFLLPTELDMEDGRQVYDVEFYTADYREYDYEIDAITGEIVTFDQEMERFLPASGAAPEAGEALTPEEAQTIALQRAGVREEDAVFTEVKREREGGWDLYELEFRAPDGAEYECGLSALTGEVVAFKCDLEHTLPPPATGSAVIKPAEIPAVYETCKAIALTHAGLTEEQVSFRGWEPYALLDWDDGRQICEVLFDIDRELFYRYDIDAQTGAVVKYTVGALTQPDLPASSSDPVPAPGGGPVTAEGAKAIALSRVPGATAGHITNFEEDYDDGRLEYEIEIRYNGMEYDFEIDAADGSVLKMESEPAD